MLNSNNAETYVRRGVAYYYKQDFQLSIRDYTEAIRLNPDKAYYYGNRANSYNSLGEREKAQADIKKAADLEKP